MGKTYQKMILTFTADVWSVKKKKRQKYSVVIQCGGRKTLVMSGDFGLITYN